MNNPGNGNCVTVATGANGVTYTWLMGTSQDKTIYKSTNLTSSNTRITMHNEQTNPSGSYTHIGEEYNEFQIINGFQYYTEIGSEFTDYENGVVTKKGTSVMSYSPGFFEGPAEKYCQQQRWFDNTKVTETRTYETSYPKVTTDTETYISDSASMGVVEAINEVINVPAGTFNTVRVRTASSYSDNITINWLSIDHGGSVKLELRDRAGNVYFSSELQSIN